MNDKQKQEIVNRLAITMMSLKGIDNLVSELFATITMGGDISDITENLLSMLKRASENFRYIQSLSETYDASRNAS